MTENDTRVRQHRHCIITLYSNILHGKQKFHYSNSQNMTQKSQNYVISKNQSCSPRDHSRPIFCGLGLALGTAGLGLGLGLKVSVFN